MIDALYKAGLSNLTDVVLSYDDTSKRVTVKCGRRVVVKLPGDIARMFGFLNDTTIRASDEKGFTLACYQKLEINIFMFIPISSRVHIMVMLLFWFFVLLQ